MKFKLSEHAKEQILERGISESLLLKVAQHPEQKFEKDKTETICQSKLNIDGKEYILRVFVNFSYQPPIIITAYLTSKISKYWSGK